MNPQRTPVLVGNWKMNLDLDGAVALARATAGIADETAGAVVTGVAVPFPYLHAVHDAAAGSTLLVGAQDVSRHEPGAHTGDVAAGMLTPWCGFAIVGHSERRQGHGETDEAIREKLARLHAAGMTALLCVGETAAQREAGHAFDVVTGQVDTALRDLANPNALIIAYEPVWAIGTGKTATPQQAQEVHAFIRGLFAPHDADLAENLVILYGGSVKGGNAAELFGMPDIDGGLIGGASLNADEFMAICRAARR